MVQYFKQDTRFEFKKKTLCRRWLKAVSESEVYKLGNISVIFCSDPYLLDINLRYLNHDYYTDIITFDYSTGNTISGDLFISVDTVRENAEFYGVSFDDELNRVIVHGVLHLMGYDDHTDEEQKQMREKEDYYLDLLNRLS